MRGVATPTAAAAEATPSGVPPSALDRESPAYPFALVRTGTGFSAGALQFAAAATAPTREALLARLAELVALHLAAARVAEVDAAPPLDPTRLDLTHYEAEGLAPDVVYVAPAAISEPSVAIARALRADGVSQAELARRMAIPRSVVTRLTDPLYFGHTTRTLRRVAEALGRHLRVSLDPHDEGVADTP